MRFKKTLISTVAALSAAVVLPASALAAPNVVSGTVTINGNATPGAKVDVTCHNNTTGVDYTKRDTSDADGKYYVTFNKNNCPDGSTVNVHARKGNRASNKSATVAGATTTVNVNVQTVPVTPVPEFGPIAAVTAAAAAGGAMLLIRRRQLGQNV